MIRYYWCFEPLRATPYLLRIEPLANDWVRRTVLRDGQTQDGLCPAHFISIYLTAVGGVPASEADWLLALLEG